MLTFGRTLHPSLQQSTQGKRDMAEVRRTFLPMLSVNNVTFSCVDINKEALSIESLDIR